jgi:hypothetical protein
MLIPGVKSKKRDNQHGAGVDLLPLGQFSLGSSAGT